jgi:peptide deformylase
MNMEIIKIHDNKGLPVASFREIRQDAEDLIAFLDERNGSFTGQYDTCFALHHCQVSEWPKSFFVIAEKWIVGSTEPGVQAKDLWPSRVIVNPKILEKPDTIERWVTDLNAVGTKVRRKMQKRNGVKLEEACMSFPHRRPKNVERFYRIKVEYQYPILGGMMLRKKREWIEGLRAHIFQHETDHDNGRNIAWGDRVK